MERPTGGMRSSVDWGLAVAALGVAVLVVLVVLPVPGRAQFSPDVRTEPGAVQVGGSLTILGSGFGLCPGVEFGTPPPVTLTLDDRDGDPQERVVQPDRDGTFEVVQQVATGPVGRWLVVASQPRCQRLARTQVDVFSFRVTPGSGPAGSGTTAVGAGFPDSAECGPVTVTFDGEVVGTAEAAGEDFWAAGFELPFVVPARPPGTYDVVAVQGDTCSVNPPDPVRRGVDDFTIPAPPGTPPPTPSPSPSPTPSQPPTPGPTPTLELEPAAGPIATEVAATATGFDPGPVELSFGPVELAPVPAAVVGTGDFATSVVVPDGVPGGLVDVTACQQCATADEQAASADFVVTPRLEIDPVLGPPGAATVTRGDGFPPTVPVALAWEPGLGGATIVPDEQGLVTGSVLVLPRDRLGERDLVITLALEELVGPTPDPALVADVEAVLPDLELVVPYLVVPGTIQPNDFAIRR